MLVEVRFFLKMTYHQNLYTAFEPGYHSSGPLPNRKACSSRRRGFAGSAFVAAFESEKALPENRVCRDAYMVPGACVDGEVPRDRQSPCDWLGMGRVLPQAKARSAEATRSPGQPDPTEGGGTSATYYQMLIGWGKQGKSYFEMSSQDSVTLELLASFPDEHVCYSARAILSFVYDRHFPMIEALANLGGQEAGMDNLVKKAWLGQNHPNPASGETTIPYEIPEIEDHRGQLKIYTLTGSKVLDVSLAAGKGKVLLAQGSLGQNLYIYQLYYAGRLIDSKKMLIQGK